MADLRGRIVVITGAAGGQGAAEANQIAAAGATVVVTDVSDDEGRALARSICDLGQQAVYRHLDVSAEDDWAALADWLRDSRGRLDGLVNNAGILSTARLRDVTAAEWERVNAVNVTGVLYGIQHMTPLMPPGSSIVNVSSVCGLTGHYRVAYTVSKWALRGLSKVACLELGPLGIRVNTVLPGLIESPMTAALSPRARAAYLAETPLERAGTIEEVAPLVAFLLSDDAAYVSGAEITVDGGQTAHGGVKTTFDALWRQRSEPDLATVGQ